MGPVAGLVVEVPSPTVPDTGYGTHSREELARALWPDKALYASVLLFVTGFVGALTGLVAILVPLQYGTDVPGWLSDWPPWIIIATSLATVVVAYVALSRRNSIFAFVACATGVLSLGFMGANVVLSLIALYFVIRSRGEGEHTNPLTRRLTADMWPDKTLAAGLLMLIVGVLTLVWGLAIAFDGVTYQGYLLPAPAFGAGAAAFGVLALIAARGLYVQKGALFALFAAVGAGVSVALWVIGPVLAATAVLLVLLGAKEREFVE